MKKKTDKTIYVSHIKMTMVKEKEFPYSTEELSGAEKAAAFAKTVLSGTDRECLLVISMNPANRPTAVEIVSVGTVNATLAEPREIFKHAILANASGIVMVHNHMSGRCIPGEDDIRITKRIEEAGILLGIPLLDHIIIGDEYFSFQEDGRLGPCRKYVERIG